MKIVLLAMMPFLVFINQEGIRWYCSTNQPSISVESYNKIKIGMTPNEVEEILGGPPRWEVEPKAPGALVGFLLIHGTKGNQWWGKNGVIKVYYYKGVVRWKNYFELPFEPRPLSFTEFVFPWTRKVVYCTHTR